MIFWESYETHKCSVSQNMKFPNATEDATISYHRTLNRSMTQNLLPNEISTSYFKVGVEM
jgi:hypothetical protein